MSSPLRHWLHNNTHPPAHRYFPCALTHFTRPSNASALRPSSLALVRLNRTPSCPPCHSRLYSSPSGQAHPKAKGNAYTNSKTKSKPTRNNYRPPSSAGQASSSTLAPLPLRLALRFLHCTRSRIYAWFDGCSRLEWWWHRAKQTLMFTAHFLNAMFFVHLVYAHIGRLSFTTGPSMLPTFATDGELILEDRFSIRHLHAPLVRGDLLVVESPIERGQMVCKRLLGLPGDVICVDPTGQLSPSTEHVKVPEGHVWISGDNAEWSRDSREYGPVPIALVKGRIVARVWPPHKFTLYHSGSGFNLLT